MYQDIDVNFKIYNTDECIFITKEKVGSTLLESMYEPNLIDQGLIFNFNIDLKNQTIIPAFQRDNKIQIQTIEDFKNCLNKNLNKKIILLYRNPYKRLQSSVVEDFSSVINSISNHEFILELLFDLFNASQYVRDFVNESKSGLHLAQLSNEPPEVIYFFKESLTRYFKHLTRTNFDNPHNQRYLFKINYVLDIDCFDLSKVILCDIDKPNNFDELLKQFDIKVDYNRKNSKNNFKEIINEICMDEYISHKIQDSLQSENMYYEILKLHSNNFNI